MGHLSSVMQRGHTRAERRCGATCDLPLACCPTKGTALQVPMHRRKHPGIRNHDLHPKAASLLPASKGLDGNQVGCAGGRSVGRRARSPPERGPRARSPERGLQVGAEPAQGLGLGTRCSHRDSTGKEGGSFRQHFLQRAWLKCGRYSCFFLAVLSVRVRFSL